MIRITDSFNRDNPPDPENYANTGPYNSTSVPSQEAYITAAWSNSEDVPDTFLIGDGSITMAGGITYDNVGLSSNTDYAYLIQIEIESDTDEVSSKSISCMYVLYWSHICIHRC